MQILQVSLRGIEGGKSSEEVISEKEKVMPSYA